MSVNEEYATYLRYQYGDEVADNYISLVTSPTYNTFKFCVHCGGKVHKRGKDKKTGRRVLFCTVCHRRTLLDKEFTEE